MNTQIIVTPSGERLVVIPEAEYQILVEAAEDAADVTAIRRFETALATGEEELIPAAFVNRLLNGENKVRVWREFRGLTIQETAARAGIDESRLAALESEPGKTDTEAFEKLAPVLRVDVEDLLPRAD